MLWTAEAVEDLKKLALEGKSASHISAALGVGSRNAVIGKASRIGIKLSGGGRALRDAARAGAARLVPNGRAAHYPRPSADARRLRRRRRLAISRSRRGTGRAAGRALAKPRSERCDGCGSRTFANPPAGGRSAIREAEISPIAGSRRSKGQSYCAGHCRMAYRSPQRATDCAGAAGLRAIASSWRLS